MHSAVGADVTDDHGAFVPGGQFVREPTGSGTLDGLRFAVKDLIDVGGVVTSGGNPDWAASQAPAAADAPDPVGPRDTRPPGTNAPWSSLTSALAAEGIEQACRVGDEPEALLDVPHGGLGAEGRRQHRPVRAALALSLIHI